MSSLECNSLSAKITKSGSGNVYAFNGRRIAQFATSNGVTIGIKSISKIKASIYKESFSPIRPSLSSDLFGVDQTTEDTVNAPFGEFEVTFFNYKRLIELATTIDPDTGLPLLESWRYYRLLVFLIANFGADQAYSLFTSVNKSDSGSRYIDFRCESTLKNVAVPQQVRKSYNDEDLQTQIINLMGGQSAYDEKIKNSGILALNQIETSLYSFLTPINSKRIYVQSPRMSYCGNNDADDNVDGREQLEVTRSNSNIYASLAFIGLALKERIRGAGLLTNRYTDKISGRYDSWDKEDAFTAKQRLYPIKDIIIEKEGVSFVNEKMQASGLFRSIDNSIVFGNYARDRERIAGLHADDNTTYITPSSIYTAGKFQYQCEVTPPLLTPKNNYLFIRAAAPTQTNETDITPSYKAYNIQLLDPSGNIITKYKDFVINGDCDYSKDPKNNFTTYIVEPEKNYAALPSYYAAFPLLGQASGYKLNIEFEAICRATPFTRDFTRGYEHECTLEERFVDTSENDYLAIDGAPFSTINQDFHIKPNNSIRISEIEILADGSQDGFLSEGILNLTLQPEPTGTLFERDIYVGKVLNGTEFVNNIAPVDSSSVWKTSPDYNGISYYSSSVDARSRGQLLDRLTNLNIAGNIELVETSPTGSGRLEVLFEQQKPFKVKQPTGGSFGFGNKYKGNFSQAKLDFVYSDDSFFTIDEISLHVKARKANSSVPDIFFDVVGYSDDCLLMTSSSPNGFLQNAASGVGLPPISSGYKPLNDLAFAGETISEKDNYFVTRSPSRGDHYTLTKTPAITSTEFQKITVPLKINRDIAELRQTPNYSMGSYFEKLYVDIYPLPSGTIISEIKLVVKHKPSAGLMCYILGHDSDNNLKHTEVRLPPASIDNNLTHTNQFISDDTSLSLIENIPHGYSNDATLKTNYARRWRGSEGTFFTGPFNPNEFAFDYYNPQVDSPFLYFYSDFSSVNRNKNHVNSQITDRHVHYNGDIGNNLVNNIGLRFNSNKLFSNQELDYATLDWTQSDDVLHGKIFDAFNNAVKIAESSGCMNFGSDVVVSGGFCAFARFTPDASVSGVGYNLFNSGALISKWDEGSDLEFLLGYKDGRLTAIASDINDNKITIQDTLDFSEYQYPLSVLLTYNDNQSKKLKLYTQNEIYDGVFDIKRAESEQFDLKSGSSDLVYGYSYGSGVGFNGYFTEIGISDTNVLGGNIIEGLPNKSTRQGNVQTFFDTHSVKFFRRGEDLTHSHNNLWKFVDEDTRKWHIGAFKYCEFSSAFDIMTNRQGIDYIYHSYSGQDHPYEDITDIQLPSNIKLDGVAYHSQIENDMLRFNLGDIENRYYAIAARVSKRIPRGYNILEDSIRVNTVIQHFCDQDIVWPDGKVGAKLIISLYTRGRENQFRDSTNWGLVNRETHYITPEDCWRKLHSNLTYNEICSNEEPWANFVTEKISEETKEVYFLNDLNQMFIQYDIVYPTGEFNSLIRINSLDVTIGDMIVKKDTSIGKVNIFASGEYEYRQKLNLTLDCSAPSEGSFDLYVSGAEPVEINDVMPLYMNTGVLRTNASVPLYTILANSIFDSFTQDPIFSDSHSDPDRENVALLLPFNNSLDDLSLNERNVQIVSDAASVLATNTSAPTYISQNAKFEQSAIFDYVEQTAKAIEVPSLTFNPEDFNNDWNIDFFFNLLETNDDPVGTNAGQSTVFLQSQRNIIFDWMTPVLMGFGAGNNKYVGMKLVFNNGLLSLQTSVKYDPLSQDEINNGGWQSLTTADVGSVTISDLNGLKYNYYAYFNTNLRYEQIKGQWTKITIRKIDNLLEIYSNAALIGKFHLDERMEFDSVDTAKHSYPHLKIYGSSGFGRFALDDFRVTIGSARGTEDDNPGFILDVPAADPHVEPPVVVPPDPDDPCNCNYYTSFPYNFCCSDDPRIGNFTVPFFIEGAEEKFSSVLNLTSYTESVLGEEYMPLYTPSEEGVLGPFEQSLPLSVMDAEIDFNNLYAVSSASVTMFVLSPPEPTFFEAISPLYVNGTSGTFELNQDMPLFLLHFSPLAQDEENPKLESFSWDQDNVGLPIEVTDNDLASIPANDEIRGVDTICFGSCDPITSYSCSEPDLITHDTIWFSSQCFNGGIFRSFTHYTNLNANAFGGEYPYVRNFYGMRKFDGLIPYNPYDIVISVMTGTDQVFEVPREITEWEYGTNEYVNYVPDKLIAAEEDRIENMNFGKSVAVNDDLMVVGVPHKSLADSTGHVMHNCGELHVYRRMPEPSGYDWTNQDHKSPWMLEAKLSLPAEFRRDSYTTSTKTFLDEKGKPLPFTGTIRSWTNQQNGRELGYSVDCTKDKHGNEIIVAGGPGSIFDRIFPPVATSPVEIALFIITNEFNPTLDPQPILDALKDKDIIYRYFSDPAVNFSVKVIICEAILDTQVQSGGDIPEPKPDFVSQYKIHRHTDYDITKQSYKDKEALILQELKNIFYEEYPLTANVLNSGIPALLSVYLDTSASLGKKSMGQDKTVGKGVLDQFVDFFKEYSYNNGLQNVSTPPVAASGHASITYDNTEGWIKEGGQALDDITDTGRMIETGAFSLFANQLGTFNTNAEEFNNVPPSGGCVYVFEKPKDKDYWHVIQEIRSPTSYTDDVSDRFGHAVSISDDGSVIGIGSPYSKHQVRILQSLEDANGSKSYNLDLVIRFNLLPWLQQNYASTLYVDLNEEISTLAGGSSVTAVVRKFYDDRLSYSQKYDFLINFVNANSNDTDVVFDLFANASYSLIYSFDAQTGGIDGWSRLYNELLPTTRLGYSIDVNEDGSTVAIGAPTDSLGSRDSIATTFRYYQGLGLSNLGDYSHHWQNYSYAGAVRLLQARKYYPHNKVVEYGKFGNLHETIQKNDNNANLFSDFRQAIYNNGGVGYVKTNFADTEIPQDAGTLYIITPEVDAASEEIIDKIKRWLSLGDRNLVLVGDDPYYEANGAYRSSNDIVNYILERLDINLRIFTARNEYEARVYPEKYDNLKQNAVAIPKMKTTTQDQVARGTLACSGVGDIRLFDENIERFYSCTYKPPSSDPFALIGCEIQPYREINYRCNMPIMHLGDLRAEWTAQCIKITPNGCTTISYPMNTAFAYGSTNEDYFGCGMPDVPKVLPKHVNYRDKSEPIPIIAAAERIQKTINVEAVEPIEVQVPIQIGEKTTNILRMESATVPNSGTKFVWSHEQPEYSQLILNLNNISSDSLFYDPEEYNEHNAVLASNAEIKNKTVSQKKSIGTAIYAAEQTVGVGSSSSIVTLIAGTYTEDRDKINDTPRDAGYNLYGNILRYEDIPSPKLALINGFTQRSSFADAYANSHMPAVLEAFGIQLEYNVSTTDLLNDSNAYDIAWIANSFEYASESEINDIKEFLAKGNKKLIITYGHTPTQTIGTTSSTIESYSDNSILAAKVAHDLCDRLELSMKPMFLPVKNHYAAKHDIGDSSDILSCITGLGSTRIAKFNNDESSLFDKYCFQRINPSNNKIIPVKYSQDFIPIITTEGSQGLAVFGSSFDEESNAIGYPVYDDALFTEGSPIFRTGLTKVTFDLPEKDESNNEDDFNVYQIVFDIVSETQYERHPINAWVEAHTVQRFDGLKIPTEAPIPLKYQKLPVPQTFNSIFIDKDIDDNRFPTTIKGSPYRLHTNSSTIEHKSLLVQVPTDETKLNIYFESLFNYDYEKNPDPLRTIRLVAVSGVRVPAFQSSTIVKEPIMGFKTELTEGSPASSYDVDIVRPITTESSKYCPSRDSDNHCAMPEPTGYNNPGPDIADGPVIVAQAVYHQGGYFNGYNKSTVTVISDASLIQGDNIIVDRGDFTSEALPDFIFSLYPYVYLESELFGSDITFGGYTYSSQYKIVAPERGSPSRYINSYPSLSGLNSRFGGYEVIDAIPHSYFSDNEGSFDLTPRGREGLVDWPNRGMMNLLQAGDIGKFTRPPIPPAKTPQDLFDEGFLIGGLNKEQFEQLWYYDNIHLVMDRYYALSKIVDTYEGHSYKDAGLYETIPPILRETGRDHLDIEYFCSGYPGDLFGWSVKFHKGELYVGCPFGAYSGDSVTSWSDVLEDNSSTGPILGVSIGNRGGAGVVYRFEDSLGTKQGTGSILNTVEPANNIPWVVKEKIAPSQLHLGYDGYTPAMASGVIGSHSYSQEFLDDNFGMPDLFGYHIDADADMLAISAPGHDFDIIYETTEAAFIRKEFNEQFNIQKRLSYDIADDDIRAERGDEAVNIINRGSIFTYEYRISDWGSKARNWTLINKINPSGINTRIQNSGENQFFGQSFAIDRAYRKDSDYILAVGNKNHAFDNTTSVATIGAGAVFTYDGMLRRLRPAYSHPETYIAGRVFGDLSRDPIDFRVNNGTEFNKIHQIEGTIHSSADGEIYIEASGHDKLDRSYSVNRPYVYSITGTVQRGIPVIQYGRLFVEGSPFVDNASIDMFVGVENQLEVYNTLDLHTQSAYFSSGNMPLFTSGKPPTSGILNFYTSGAFPPESHNIEFFIRGF